MARHTVPARDYEGAVNAVEVVLGADDHFVRISLSREAWAGPVKLEVFASRDQGATWEKLSGSVFGGGDEPEYATGGAEVPGSVAAESWTVEHLKDPAGVRVRAVVDAEVRVRSAVTIDTSSRPFQRG